LQIVGCAIAPATQAKKDGVQSVIATPLKPHHIRHGQYRPA
jgi:hypothetical protein